METCKIGFPGTHQLIEFLRNLDENISARIEVDTEYPILVECQTKVVGDTAKNIQISKIRIADGKLYVLQRTGSLQTLKDFGYPLEMMEVDRNNIDSIYNNTSTLPREEIEDKISELKEAIR